MTDPNVVILRALLEGQDRFVSGTDLAQRLGITRVGVWARLERLREAGFVFEAIRHRGYRLVREPTKLYGPLVQAYLGRAGSMVKLHYHETIDSTNAEAERLLAAGEPDPVVVLAARQNGGRGRMGRQWHSPPEGNIYVSLIFRPQIVPHKMQAITLWMGLRLCAALQRDTGIEIKIKWPNDLYAQGRKVAGILTEARVSSDRTRDLVIGLGLNVNSRLAKWPAELQASATSLADVLGADLPVSRLAATMILDGLEAYRTFMAGDVMPQLRHLWPHYDLLRGRVIRAQGHDEPITGTVLGLDDLGGLLVEGSDGKVRALRAGEVTLGSNQLTGGPSAPT